MAAAASSMLELGTSLPSFELPDTVSGRAVSSESLRGSVAVVAFLCNHCPYVQHIAPRLAARAAELVPAGVRWVGISSNDVARYPQDGPEAMRVEAERRGYVFPYLYDETQSVARAFHAVCTPEFYVFDAAGKLAYRGRFDASRPGSGVPVTGEDLERAVRALLSGVAPSGEQRPSIGCSIKWKSE